MNKCVDGTFKNNKKIHIHRWYPYVEGFSEDFVLECLKGQSKNAIIYDPFNGSGTTTTTCSMNGYLSIASEVNPFMRFVSETKTNTVKNILTNKKIKKLKQEKQNFIDYINEERRLVDNINDCYKDFSFFSDNNLLQISVIKNYYTNSIVDNDIKNIFKLALSSILVKVSNMTRSTDLRRKTEKEKKNITDDVYKEFISTIEDYISDLEVCGKNTHNGNDMVSIKIISNDAKIIDTNYYNYVDCIITSPPYINGTNYFRNTKLELWILDYIFSDNDSKKYRSQAIVAGINNVTKDTRIDKKRESVDLVVREIAKLSPDKRIPKMIEGYFSDMEKVFSNFSNMLKKDGKLFFDIGDSQYYGQYVPVFDIIIEIAEEYNLKLYKNEVIRSRVSKNGMKLSQKLLIFKKVNENE